MSALRCARCNRELLSVTVQVGSLAVGPTCARHMGITPPRSQTRKSTLARGPGRRKARGEPVNQLALFEVLA